MPKHVHPALILRPSCLPEKWAYNNKTGTLRINIKSRPSRLTIVGVEKQYICVYIYIYSKCVPVVLIIQHTKKLLYIVLSSVACVDVVFLLCHQRINFRKKS